MRELYIDAGSEYRGKVGNIVDYTVVHLEPGDPIQIIIEFTDEIMHTSFYEKIRLLKCIAFKSDRAVLYGYDVEIKKLPDAHKRLIVIYEKMLWGNTLDTALIFKIEREPGSW